MNEYRPWNNQESRHEVLRRVQERLWQNISGSDLLERIVLNSTHAAQRTHEAPYERLELVGCLNYIDRSFNVQIFIHERDMGQSSLGPVTIYVDRLAKSRDEKEALVKKIWTGVDPTEQRAILDLRMDDALVREHEVLAGARIRRERNPRLFDRAIKDAERNISDLELLKQQVSAGAPIGYEMYSAGLRVPNTSTTNL